MIHRDSDYTVLVFSLLALSCIPIIVLASLELYGILHQQIPAMVVAQCVSTHDQLLQFVWGLR